MIKKIQYDNVNVCRRFQNKTLINFVNTLIPFDKYKLPQYVLIMNIMMIIV